MQAIDPERGSAEGTAGRAPDTLSRELTPSQEHRVVEPVQTFITAMILAFMFRAFLIEAFIIPTGSMAPGLLGDHGTLVCPHCGWEFDYGPAYGGAADGQFILPEQALCPNCLLETPLQPSETPIKAGDRILVHKWPYLVGGLLAPARWDVIVFRDPANPFQNYIKRLIGLPGETLEIIGGDVYIDGKIARKPPAVQQVLWQIVFDQDYRPVDAPAGRSTLRWATPPGSGWIGEDRRVLRFDPAFRQAAENSWGVARFEGGGMRAYFEDVYGYDHRSSGRIVGDIRLSAELQLASPAQAALELVVERRRLRLELAAGRQPRLVMRDESVAGRDWVILESPGWGTIPNGRPIKVRLAHVDRQVVVEIAGMSARVTTKSEYETVFGSRARQRLFERPEVSLRARSGKVTARRVRIERDIYYTDSPNSLRATQAPFSLRSEEYFVLGDNSPQSHDSREWYRVGSHLPADYRVGTVRASQIVGQAFLVYLPGLQPVSRDGTWRLPDLGRVRFVR